MPDTPEEQWAELRRENEQLRTLLRESEERHAAHIDALTAAVQEVDDGWYVVEGDEGRDRVRLRYASDLPARLNKLRAILKEPHDA